MISPVFKWCGWVHITQGGFASQALGINASLLGVVREKKIASHILIHCGKARGLWHLLFSSFGISRILLNLVRKALLCWHESSLGREGKFGVSFGLYGGNVIIDPLMV
ncbi:hypothetical protein CK203_072506 [Vitis vinifera]|uniref:Uncharacterized protein n=1 Tax=Vitis vinifera TaxID=29760 RepID=A0A438F963_VITVI|nr:hypothetical protein CK203_072506 [Vitis vinifera]